MGGYERFEEKHRNYAHGSDQKIQYKAWRAQVNSHPLVQIDTSFPQFVQNNIEYLIEIGLIDPS